MKAGDNVIVSNPGNPWFQKEFKVVGLNGEKYVTVTDGSGREYNVRQRNLTILPPDPTPEPEPEFDLEPEGEPEAEVQAQEPVQTEPTPEPVLEPAGKGKGKGKGKGRK